MIGLNCDWKFKDVQNNVEAIKTQYEDVLSSFLCYETKEKTETLKAIKKEVFKFTNLQYWQRERLWEVLNEDLEIEKFKKIGG